MDKNPKASLKVLNKTNFFNPSTSRIYNEFSSPLTYQFRSQKIEGYESRLYWQFRYCEDHNGQTYFYTLTYNDKHIPRHYGMNCFDYEDLRDLLTGGFRKKLLRKYGTKFKYFVGAELGDGKGSRGMHNNPHYHILFFLESANDARYPYVKISPKEFRTLVKTYWQGFDESVDGYRSYNDAKYGIAREGENLGLVSDFRACMYCAKYVSKDVNLKKSETRIRHAIRFSFENRYKNSEDSYKAYFRSRLFELYNTPLNAKKTEWLFSDIDLIKYLKTGIIPDAGFGIRETTKTSPFLTTFLPICYSVDVPEILTKFDLWQDYYDFVNLYLDAKAHEALVEWRNRFSNKCRVSQGLGDYALQFISDPLNPSIQVPSKKGFKARPIGMYYYRKLYTEVIDYKGEKVRILNDLGIRYKVNRLPSLLEKFQQRIKMYYSIIEGNPSLYEKVFLSDCNVNVYMSYSEVSLELKKLLEDVSLDEIIKRYSEFKFIYKHRFFDFRMSSYPDIDPISDYRRFIIPQVFSTPKNPGIINDFISTTYNGYEAYSLHPYFLKYHRIFLVFDLLSDYFFIQKDNVNQAKAEEIAATKRFHDRLKLKKFYSAFLQ